MNRLIRWPRAGKVFAALVRMLCKSDLQERRPFGAAVRKSGLVKLEIQCSLCFFWKFIFFLNPKFVNLLPFQNGLLRKQTIASGSMVNAPEWEFGDPAI